MEKENKIVEKLSDFAQMMKERHGQEAASHFEKKQLLIDQSPSTSLKHIMSITGNKSRSVNNKSTLTVIPDIPEQEESPTNKRKHI